MSDLEVHEGASHSMSCSARLPHFLIYGRTDEQLISAARYDNEDILLEVFKHPDKFDINHRDGCVHS